MTDNEKVQAVQTLVSDEQATSDIVSLYLAVARDAILNRLYPHGIPDDNMLIPARYEYTQCKLAARYFLRRGAEGEITHSENGIARTYGTTDDGDILNEVLPYAKVAG